MGPGRQIQTASSRVPGTGHNIIRRRTVRLNGERRGRGALLGVGSDHVGRGQGNTGTVNVIALRAVNIVRVHDEHIGAVVEEVGECDRFLGPGEGARWHRVVVEVHGLIFAGVLDVIGDVVVGPVHGEDHGAHVYESLGDRVLNKRVSERHKGERSAGLSSRVERGQHVRITRVRDQAIGIGIPLRDPGARPSVDRTRDSVVANELNAAIRALDFQNNHRLGFAGGVVRDPGNGRQRVCIDVVLGLPHHILRIERNQRIRVQGVGHESVSVVGVHVAAVGCRRGEIDPRQGHMVVDAGPRNSRGSGGGRTHRDARERGEGGHTERDPRPRQVVQIVRNRHILVRLVGLQSRRIHVGSAGQATRKRGTVAPQDHIVRVGTGESQRHGACRDIDRVIRERRDRGQSVSVDVHRRGREGLNAAVGTRRKHITVFESGVYDIGRVHVRERGPGETRGRRHHRRVGELQNITLQVLALHREIVVITRQRKLEARRGRNQRHGLDRRRNGNIDTRRGPQVTRGVVRIQRIRVNLVSL